MPCVPWDSPAKVSLWHVSLWHDKGVTRHTVSNWYCSIVSCRSFNTFFGRSLCHLKVTVAYFFVTWQWRYYTSSNYYNKQNIRSCVFLLSVSAFFLFFLLFRCAHAAFFKLFKFQNKIHFRRQEIEPRRRRSFNGEISHQNVEKIRPRQVSKITLLSD